MELPTRMNRLLGSFSRKPSSSSLLIYFCCQQGVFVFFHIDALRAQHSNLGGEIKATRFPLILRQETLIALGWIPFVLFGEEF